MPRLYAGLVSAAFLVLASQSAGAVEYNFPNFPSGTTGANVATLPPFPGFFVLNQTTYNYADALYGNDAKKEDIPFKSKSTVSTTRFLISYPFLLPYQGQVYSQLTLPFIDVNTKVYGYSQHQGGLANPAFSPIIASWRSKFNLTTTVGIDIVTGGGSYGEGGTGASTGYWTFCPNIAMRWDNPHGLDVGGLLRFELNNKDPNTQYKSGDLFTFDYIAGWNFGHWEVAAVGNLVHQYSNDVEAGGIIPVGGNKDEYVAVGPSVSYAGTMFGVHYTANLNLQYGVYARNTSNNRALWLNLTFPLFAPKPHFPAPSPTPGNGPSSYDTGSLFPHQYPT